MTRERKKHYAKLLLPAIILMLSAVPSAARSDSLPYRSYAYGTTGWPFYMQSPYIPIGIIGQSLFADGGGGPPAAVKGLNNPGDFYIASDGAIYIADTGNARVVKVSQEGLLLKEYGKDLLSAPEGVYVAGDGTVYVADTGHGQLVKFEPGGNVSAILKAPDDARISGMMFTPVDIAVDDRGFIYVLLKGNNEGLLIMTPEGGFQGFFARNNTQVALEERIKRIFYTREQVATNANVVAASVTGLAYGKDGFVYTCTSTLKEGQVKKFNANGVDLFNSLDTRVTVNRRTGALSAISSLFVDESGVIYTVDNMNGAVILYDANGKPLLMFGEKLSGNERRIGFFSDPVAISVSKQGTLMVLDRAYNGIHMFRPAPLTATILEAVALYNDGRYEQAEGMWQAILKANSSYYLANQGLGRVAYMRGQWQESMAQMRLAMDQTHYSEALWKYRALVTQQYAGTVMAALLILAAAHLILTRVFHVHLFRLARRAAAKVRKKTILPLYKAAPWLGRRAGELRYSLNIIRHPVDTYYEATRGTKGSVPTAFILFFLFLCAMLLDKALVNFVFDAYGIRGLSLATAALTYVLPVFLWGLGNYLVGAITKGQGTLRGIIISIAYALIPMMLFSPLLALLSNVLTLAEGSIYWISRTVLMLWTALLLVLQVKEIHGYEVGETLRNILWILFVAAMAMVAAAAMGGIFYQAYNFLNEFFRELFAYV